MLQEAILGLLAFGLAIGWGLALLWTGRARHQPALTAYLLFSSASGSAVMYGRHWGLITSEVAYLYVYVASGLGALALLAAAFLELATLSLTHFPRFQRSGSALVHGLLTATLAMTIAVAAIPLQWTYTISEALFAATSFIYASLGMVWILFVLASRFWRLTLDGRPTFEGWILASVALSFALFLGWAPGWYRLGVVVVSAVGFGTGAVICLAPSLFPNLQPVQPARLNHEDSAAVGETLARLDLVEQGLAVAGKE